MAAIDENDVYDTWEELEDSGVLDKKITILQSRAATKENSQPISNTNGGHVILDESVRPYYGPPLQDPQVKILKRPSKNSDNVTSLNGDKPKQHKTLQQREQEYAEARLRILGQARSPEEDLKTAIDDSVNLIQSKLESLETNEGTSNNEIINIKNDNIIRNPRGPDGTKGFIKR